MQMTLPKILAAVAATLVLLIVVRLAYLSMSTKTPNHLGAKNGKLAPCPESPNCVSSQALRPAQRIEPLAVVGTPDEAIDLAVAAIDRMKRTRVVERDGGYLRAEFRSFLFRFTDDLELLYDPDVPGFQVRSASRAGHSDLGANRRRIEELRARLHQR